MDEVLVEPGVGRGFLDRGVSAAQQVSGGSSFFTDLRLGWREFRSHTWLWLLTVQGAVWWLLVMPPMWVLGAVVAREDLGGAGAWGAIGAAFGAGTVAGGLLLLRVQPRRPLMAGVAASLLFVAPLVLLAVRAPAAAVAAGAFAGGGGLTVLGTLRGTTIQREVSPQTAGTFAGTGLGPTEAPFR